MMAAIIGGLGSGKTATLTYMGLKYYSQNYKIYSNYHLLDPGTTQPLSEIVTTDEDLDQVRDGYFLGDELWSWIDSRASLSNANKFASDLLLKSRKRGFNLIYTTQSMGQMDKRVRENTDYIIVPVMNLIYEGRKIKVQQSILETISLKPFLEYMYVEAFVFSTNEVLVDEFGFQLQPIAQCYDTTQEIDPLSKTGTDKIKYEPGAKPWAKNGQETELKFYNWLLSQTDYVEWLSEKKKSEYDHFAIKDGIGYYFDVVGYSRSGSGIILNTKDKHWPTKVRWLKEYGNKPLIGGFLTFSEDDGQNWRFLKIHSRLPKGGVLISETRRNEQLMTLSEVIDLAKKKQIEAEVSEESEYEGKSQCSEPH